MENNFFAPPLLNRQIRFGYKKKDFNKYLLQLQNYSLFTYDEECPETLYSGSF